jgi:hypothetical protein
MKMISRFGPSRKAGDTWGSLISRPLIAAHDLRLKPHLSHSEESEANLFGKVLRQQKNNKVGLHYF